MTHTWDALGTKFTITIWDDLLPERQNEITATAVRMTEIFDEQYSRFRTDSLITLLSKETGVFEVPHDLTKMLRLYEALYVATKGSMTPAIGFALEDTGYDRAYTLSPKETVRVTPDLTTSLRILSDTHIELMTPILLDLGALGKGYLVDLLHDFLQSEGCTRFLVDGSGDVRFSGGGAPIVCGLEHPYDQTLAIGTFTLADGSLCASATNRRAWRQFNHYLDPLTNTSPTRIVATWAYAQSAALADALSTALFFADPESLRARFPFEYLVLDRDLHAKSSAGFAAELFT